jgi:hypothetical protein
MASGFMLVVELVVDIDGRRAAGRVLKLHSHQNGV